MSPQRKELEKHLKEMCQGMGFKKSKYMYYKQVTDEFIATIMFPCASYQVKYHILVACAVGICSNQIWNVFKQCAEINNVKYDNIIQTNLGYIAPQNHYMEWDYSEQSDPSIFFCEIQKEIERYAYPFFDKYSNMDNLTGLILSGKFHTTTDRDILLSIIYYLHGDKNMALEYLDRLVKKRQNDRGFSDIFEERFNNNFRKLLQ